MRENTAADSGFAVVVTSIASPNRVMRELAEGCGKNGKPFIVVGDVSSPRDFTLNGCDYYDVKRQIDSGFGLAAMLPTKHYSRKNLGYLLAMRDHIAAIVETD